MIVCNDVNIEEVAPKVTWGAFRNSSQVCIASKRIYVHQDIYEPFVRAMVEAAKNLNIGPIQNRMQYEKVLEFIEDSKKQGHKVLIGADQDHSHTNEKGYYIKPTIYDNPSDDSKIVMEEPFGPIVPVMPWSSEEEVIERANNTNYGLGACVWSADIDRARRIGEEMEAGSVWINEFERPMGKAYMSGFKESGLGGEGGRLGLLAYMNTQSVYVPKK